MRRIFFRLSGVLVFVLALGVCGAAFADNQQDVYTNLALTAKATASTNYDVSSFVADNINDGIMNRWNQGEWASSGEGAGAWVQLAWDSAVKMNQVWLYSRPNKYDMIYDSHLYIDTDGDTSTWEYTVHVGMQGQGGVPKIVNLTSSEGASVRTLRFYVDEVSSDTQNAGLAEIECYMINGDTNTSLGNHALYTNTSGTNNTAVGYATLSSNEGGTNNTATGYYALYSNISGIGNTATGDETLYSNTEGNRNTATGYKALYSNETGYMNTATGYSALYYNGIGDYNTATGYYALYENTGYRNTATGYYALYFNTSGNYNTAVGYKAGRVNDTGSNNTFIGYNADAGSSGLSNATAIGANATVGESDALVLGNAVSVGIGTSVPDTNAILELNSTTKAFLPPRTTSGSINSPVAGMIIYDTDANKLKVYTGGAWETITSSDVLI